MLNKHLFLLTSATCASLASLVIKRKQLLTEQIYVFYTQEAAHAVLGLDLPLEQTLAIDSYKEEFASLLNVAQAQDFSLSNYFALVQSYYQLIANFLEQRQYQYAQINAQTLTLPEFCAYVPCLDTIEAQALANHPQCQELSVIEADISAYVGNNHSKPLQFTEEFAEFYQDYPQASYYATGIAPYTACRALDLIGLMNQKLGTSQNPITFYRANVAAFYWLGAMYEGRQLRLETFSEDEIARLPQPRAFSQHLVSMATQMRQEGISQFAIFKANLWVIDALTLQLLTPEHFADYLVRMGEKFSFLAYKKVLVKLDVQATATQKEQVSLALQEYGVEAIFLENQEYLYPIFLTLPPNSFTVHGLFAPELCYAVAGRQTWVNDLILGVNYPEVEEFCRQANFNINNLLKSFTQSLGIDLRDAQRAEKLVALGRERFTKYLWQDLADQAFVNYEKDLQTKVTQILGRENSIFMPTFRDVLGKNLETPEKFKTLEAENKKSFAFFVPKEVNVSSTVEKQEEKQIVSAVKATSASAREKEIAKTSTLDTEQANKTEIEKDVTVKSLASKETVVPTTETISDLEISKINPIYLDHSERELNAKALKSVKEKGLQGSASDLNVLAQARNMVGIAKKNLEDVALQRKYANTNSVESDLSVAYVVASQRLEKEQEQATRKVVNPFAFGINEQANKVLFAPSFLQTFVQHQLTFSEKEQNLPLLATGTLKALQQACKLVKGFSALETSKFEEFASYPLLDFIYSGFDLRKHKLAKVFVVDDADTLIRQKVWYGHKGMMQGEIMVLTTKPEILLGKVDYFHRTINYSSYAAELEAKPYFNIKDLVNVGFTLQARIQAALGYLPTDLYVSQFNKSVFFMLITNLPLAHLHVLQRKGVAPMYHDLGLGAMHKLLAQFKQEYQHLLAYPRLVQEKHGIDDILYSLGDEEGQMYTKYVVRGTRFNIQE
ncbi:hypothetical protein [Psittacicella gerlachiana]|uniref:Uncharacterized protein n=1 Tax=Psittacicella gerlachiana TaxID=2028574 RepID=A0A3A1YCQ7_9GAMM|nr:hypothetical protein [Psittacicella gerlachiana]RIY34950.1 hypothetical protein CKF59_04410 [Psittacicella gerlachiana]